MDSACSGQGLRWAAARPALVSMPVEYQTAAIEDVERAFVKGAVAGLDVG